MAGSTAVDAYVAQRLDQYGHLVHELDVPACKSMHAILQVTSLAMVCKPANRAVEARASPRHHCLLGQQDQLPQGGGISNQPRSWSDAQPGLQEDESARQNSLFEGV